MELKDLTESGKVIVKELAVSLQDQKNRFQDGREPEAMKKMILSERDILMKNNYYSYLYNRRNSFPTLDFHL